jgi:hypothetical protein
VKKKKNKKGKKKGSGPVEGVKKGSGPVEGVYQTKNDWWEQTTVPIIQFFDLLIKRIKICPIKE